MLYAQIVPVQSVILSQRKEMFLLLEQYYEKVEWNRFLNDLDDKDDVILLFERESDKIKGFSTLKNIRIKQNNRNSILHIDSGRKFHPDFESEVEKSGFLRPEAKN